ncbi:hypothetical protein J2W22_000470 [Sphingomonas kyeonggiensis]|uniref:hypothetical protein n=1 Tax=Sphingomonas kyeonggiensis TaxID=1268553 RepID=UPI00277E40E5|nr:hypothetical protein [Sphingomonas kyeonggiensis]MDQ0248423.1 hypothetical protein [Sphingomonas kyeonggiensis]
MIDRFLDGFNALHEYPGDISTPIQIPGDLDPFERHERFTLYIDAELRMSGLGSAGGGWQVREYDEADDEDDGRVVYSMIDADVTELEMGLALIREQLAELGCPPGTLVQYDSREDRWDGERWHRGEARSVDEEDAEPWRGDKG